MLQIRNLTIRHKMDLRTILEDFTLNVQSNDKIVMIGEEGNGKSTLLKLIYDSRLVDDYVEYEGIIDKKKLRLGFLYQELEKEELEYNVYEYLMNEINHSGLELNYESLGYFASKLKLSKEFIYSNQTVETLSGGEKIKLQLLKLQSIKYDIILLDEPSNDIDMDTLLFLEDFINDSQIPIIFVSHDEDLIKNTANKVIHLEQIMRKTKPIYTVSKLEYEDYVVDREHRINKQIHDAINEKKEYGKKEERFLKIQQKVTQSQNAVSRQDPHGGALLKKKMKNVMAMGKRMKKEKENLTKRPDIEESLTIKFPLASSIPNGKKVLDFFHTKLEISNKVLCTNINLQIFGSEKIVITGKNGSGKSTLLKLILEELKERKDIKVGYMPQNYDEVLPPDKTPVEYLSSSGDKEDLDRIKTYLGSMKYTIDEMSHSCSELSGGQKAKILLLKMSLDGVNVMILDEPTRNFSPMSSPVIRESLKNFEGAIISVSHDRAYIREVCTNVYGLEENGLRKIEL